MNARLSNRDKAALALAFSYAPLIGFAVIGPLVSTVIRFM